jgi:oxygen-independent coproporphyrinogen-3 oxidase
MTRSGVGVLPTDELERARRDGTLRRNFMGYTTRAGLELIGIAAPLFSQTV